MKKIGVTFLVILLSGVFMLGGCGNRTLDVLKTYTVSSSNDEMYTKSEIDFWTGNYFEKNNMNSRKYKIFGDEYTGSYKKSIVNNYNSYTTDIFKDANNVEFGVRADTGTVVYLNLMTSQFFRTEIFLDDIDDPFENALAMSKNIANEFLTNIDLYEVIINEPREDSGEIDGKNYSIKYYMITYAKRIDGYLSSDYIDIKITSKGHLASLYMGDVGAFDNVSVNVVKDSANQSLIGKINEIYKSKHYPVNNVDIYDQTIVLTPTGNICLYSQVKVETTDSSGDILNSKISFITVVQ